ncbi:hypothetical protein ABGN05_20355 [Aquibium sp. LZ166]|uniref:Uncharacterized protein n=1 Tax=Aquibium pacificus TaxID=3153579 RepID=A0ABV3SMK8_9HYPH
MSGKPQNRKRPFNILTVFTFCIIGMSTELSAAEVKCSAEEIFIDVPLYVPEWVNIIQVHGPIREGDFEQIRDVLGEPTAHFTNCEFANARPGFVVELNSQGGDLLEALKIGSYLRRKGAGTYIPPSGECLSSCAVIFMGGSRHTGDATFVPSRTLHYSGKLGFHSPFTDASELSGLPSKNLEYVVVNAYEAAINIAAKIIVYALQTEWSSGLVQRMLDTPKSDLFVIDTVDKVGRWGISVYGLPAIEKPSEEDLYVACKNFGFWGADSRRTVDEADDLIAGDILEFHYPEGMESTLTFLHRELSDGGHTIFRFTSEFDGPECVFTISDHGVSSDSFPFSSLSVVPGYNTLIDAYSMLERRKTGKVDNSEYIRFLDGKWIHNGSIMKFYISEGSIGVNDVSITYYEPKPQLRHLPAGTVLFSGRIHGTRMVGNAKIFNRKCGPIEYLVQGDIFGADRDRVVLSGSAPKRGGDCKIREWVSTGPNTNLVFERLR